MKPTSIQATPSSAEAGKKKSTAKRVSSVEPNQPLDQATRPARFSKADLRTVKKQAADKALLDHLLRERQTLRERVAGPIVHLEPILTQDDQGIVWPRTICLLQGQTGAHKSRVAELFSSVVLALDRFQGESLGLKADSSVVGPCAVCYVDTERNQHDQFIQAMQQVKYRAGYDLKEHPVNFEYISLLATPRTKRLKALKLYLQQMREQIKGHLLIVLDQVADCVTDFNDQKECVLLTDLLNEMVNQQNVTFLCVIHENPGSFKARGHLGTELANKASTVLQVGFIKASSEAPSEVVRMKYVKRRSGAPGLKFHARFDTEQGELVRVEKDAVKEAQDSRKQTARPADIIPILSALLTSKMPRKQLLEELRKAVGGGDKTLDNRLKEIIEQQIPVPNAKAEMCLLQTQKGGRETLYWLEPVTSANTVAG